VRHTLSGGHEGTAVLSCAVANGTRALSGGANNTLRIWDLENHSLVGSPLLGHSGSVTCIKAAKGVVERCAIFFSASSDATIKKWQVSMEGTAMVLATYMGHDGPVRSISLYDGDRKIASGGFDGAIKVLLVRVFLVVTRIYYHHFFFCFFDMLK
jgi:WD40 repeat protein